jgi:hypothetical protein
MDQRAEGGDPPRLALEAGVLLGLGAGAAVLAVVGTRRAAPLVNQGQSVSVGIVVGHRTPDGKEFRIGQARIDVAKQFAQ